ncbi:MAG: hypothetical protein JWQ34_1322 [Mucilaginibacter sp.]|uniref:hypothetical protein n=1 Tax=Mucilaginibacter sp. TaxID=1882438 RepID=UPI0026323138|nr:hypothetical protein [Mucilaginibacter sp.]MDB5003097.1 hypothetical protein [Mucilaginibacter sp.]
MKRNILTAALLLCSVLICFAAAITDLTGKWKGSVKMADGNEFPLTYNFKVDGQKITGSVLSPQGELPIYDGKISSDKDFTFKVDVNDNPVPNVGKFYGDSVTVVADLDGQKLHATLKRVVVK